MIVKHNKLAELFVEVQPSIALIERDMLGYFKCVAEEMVKAWRLSESERIAWAQALQARLRLILRHVAAAQKALLRRSGSTSSSCRGEVKDVRSEQTCRGHNPGGRRRGTGGGGRGGGCGPSTIQEAVTNSLASATRSSPRAAAPPPPALPATGDQPFVLYDSALEMACRRMSANLHGTTRRFKRRAPSSSRQARGPISVVSRALHGRWRVHVVRLGRGRWSAAGTGRRPLGSNGNTTRSICALWQDSIVWRVPSW